MSDLIIRDIDEEMRSRMEARARAHSRDVSEEARVLLRESLGLSEESSALTGPPPGMSLGTWLFSIVPPEYRVDLNCDMTDVPSDPPDFS